MVVRREYLSTPQASFSTAPGKWNATPGLRRRSWKNAENVPHFSPVVKPLQGNGAVAHSRIVSASFVLPARATIAEPLNWWLDGEWPVAEFMLGLL